MFEWCLLTGSALFRDGICEWWWFDVSNSAMRKVQGTSRSVSIVRFFFFKTKRAKKSENFERFSRSDIWPNFKGVVLFVIATFRALGTSNCRMSEKKCSSDCRWHAIWLFRVSCKTSGAYLNDMSTRKNTQPSPPPAYSTTHHGTLEFSFKWIVSIQFTRTDSIRSCEHFLLVSNLCAGFMQPKSPLGYFSYIRAVSFIVIWNWIMFCSMLMATSKLRISECAKKA